jgi:hypothetical protein
MLTLLLSALAADPARTVETWTADVTVRRADDEGLHLAVTWSARLRSGATCAADDWAHPLTAADCGGRRPVEVTWTRGSAGVDVLLNGVEAAVLDPTATGEVVVPAARLGAALLGPGDGEWAPGPVTLSLRPDHDRPARTIARADDAVVDALSAAAWKCAAARSGQIDPTALSVEAWIDAVRACPPALRMVRARDAACARAEQPDPDGCALDRADAPWWVEPDDLTWTTAPGPVAPPVLAGWRDLTCDAVLHLDASGAPLGVDLGPACAASLREPVRAALRRAHAEPFIHGDALRPVHVPFTWRFPAP